MPGYVQQFDELKMAGVDEIWCVSVNDAFVMGAWARDQKTAGKVRMLGDGSAAFTHAVGLTLDLTARGMGVRSNRYSMLVRDGKVVGVVSDRDVRVAQGLGTEHRFQVRAADIMATDPVMVPASMPLDRVAFTMSDRKIGSVIVNVAPDPGCEVTATLPPWARAMCSTSARPMPEPRIGRSRTALAR